LCYIGLMRTLAQFAEQIRRDVERYGWVEVPFYILQDEIAKWAVDDFTNFCLLLNGHRGAGANELYEDFVRMVGYAPVIDPETRRIRFALSTVKTALDVCIHSG